VRGPFALAVVMVAATAVVGSMLGGCGASVGSTAGDQGSLQATASQGLIDGAADTSGAIDAQGQTGSASSGAAAEPPATTTQDIKTIDAELNAMQKELDGLAMPSDSDFTGAEGALY
jgi:hypothetical protein